MKNWLAMVSYELFDKVYKIYLPWQEKYATENAYSNVPWEY